MKKAFALALTALVVPWTFAQTSVGVSIGINQPGVYGRINIGDVPQPALVLPQPVIIAQEPVYRERRPIYLYVPPAHQRDWHRYCRSYSACGQPVYFVRDEWVRDRYQQEHPGWNRGNWKGHGHDHDHDHDNERGDRKNGKGNGRDR